MHFFQAVSLHHLHDLVYVWRIDWTFLRQDNYSRFSRVCALFSVAVSALAMNAVFYQNTRICVRYFIFCLNFSLCPFFLYLFPLFCEISIRKFRVQNSSGRFFCFTDHAHQLYCSITTFLSFCIYISRKIIIFYLSIVIYSSWNEQGKTGRHRRQPPSVSIDLSDSTKKNQNQIIDDQSFDNTTHEEQQEKGYKREQNYDQEQPMEEKIPQQQRELERMNSRMALAPGVKEDQGSSVRKRACILPFNNKNKQRREGAVLF